MAEDGVNPNQLPMRTAMEFPNALPLLRLSNQVAFPMSLLPMHVEDAGDRLLIEDSAKGHRLIVLTALRPDAPATGELERAYEVGCIGRILQVQPAPEEHLNVMIQAVGRCRIESLIRRDPYWVVQVSPLQEPPLDLKHVAPLMLAVRMQMTSLFQLMPQIPEGAQALFESVDDPGFLADLIAAHLNLSLPEKQEILETLDREKRLERLMHLLQREIEFVRASSKIRENVQSSFDKNQREYFLRQQLRAIQEELGEGQEGHGEAEEYRKKVLERNLPEEVAQEALREVNRLARMHEASAEYNVAVTYLDTLLELPWNDSTADHLDLARAEKVLNEDHYGLDKVKNRILDYLAVRKLKPNAHGPILCFLGPPGVGKTSLGQSIARALDRKFLRMALGGMRDEAEIRGHRRTYIGALPGRILQGLRKAGSNNPVFMLDEIDKIGNGFQGDPSSALLEVLDPAQNHSFTDHYLNVPFDLSKVLFIATANVIDTVPWALRDRMEVIEIPGYTLDEKLQIARRYLAPKQIEAHGLTPKKVQFGVPALRHIAANYTREAGVRNLDREIAAVCRGCARKFAGGRRTPIRIEIAQLTTYLGHSKVHFDMAERTRQPGVAIGLAWTALGGDILFIEATRMPGQGKLNLTGQLGDVMKESAQAALSFLRANAGRLGLRPEDFAQYDIHVHVPAGAVPKDGPSAGVTMLTAMASLVSGKRVKSALAMTGEITLRGTVLPVGGIKEKVLAAARARIRHLILPERCRNDYDEVPQTVRNKLNVHFAQEVQDVLKVALGIAWRA